MVFTVYMSEIFVIIYYTAVTDAPCNRCELFYNKKYKICHIICLNQ